ncbi:MAG: ANTAR domain-containing protein [Clostridiales bacterium]|nr:ANTAR domain-containing protein [Clostridiales bacterium]
MKRVLIVSEAGKGCDLLYNLIESTSNYEIITALSGGEARQIVFTEDYDIIVINMPLSDESGLELSEKIVAETGACVILIVHTERYDEILYRYEEKGIAVLEKPLSRQAFLHTLRLMTALHNRLNNLRFENNTLKSKIDEIRMVDRAKCVLIQYLGMTEPMAHRHIEKQAMDMRVSKRRIAEDILRTYEM